MNRRQFLGLTTGAAIGLAVAPDVFGFDALPIVTSLAPASVGLETGGLLVSLSFVSAKSTPQHVKAWIVSSDKRQPILDMTISPHEVMSFDFLNEPIAIRPNQQLMIEGDVDAHYTILGRDTSTFAMSHGSYQPR